MRTRKNHHYVPQFYLKNFSSTDSGKEIGLYHHQKDIYIPAAPLKHQACEKFLYGEDDEIENLLSKLENYAAQTIRKLIELKSPPPANTIYFQILEKFILYQLFRTISAGTKTNNMLSSSVKEIFKLMAYDQEKYKNLVFRHTQPTLLSLLHSMEGYPLMNHLACKAIINLTNIPFITSDNPALKYNQFLETRKTLGGNTALAIKGLQIFFPINPRMLIIFYDPYVYKLKEKREAVLYTCDDNDIWQLNALQYIHCDKQLFFDSGISKQYLHKLVAQFKSKRKEFTYVNNVNKNETSPNGDTKYFFLNSFHEPKIKLSLSFITLTKNAKQFEIVNEMPPLRHESFYKTKESDRDTEKSNK